MLASGFLDAYYLTNKKFKHSVPAEGIQEKNSIARRIDYIWVNQSLAGAVQQVDIIQDSTTRRLSDHYPVFMVINSR